MKQMLFLSCGLLFASQALAAADPAVQEPTVVMKEVEVMGEKIQTPVVVAPHYLPTLKRDMTAKQAAEALSLTLPIVVTNMVSLEDGGTIKGVIVDAKGKRVAFRRSPWAHKEPVYYYIDSPTPNDKPIKLKYDGEQLKALSVITLHWVDTTFTKDQQKKIREKQEGRTQGEADAAQILWLFRAQKK
jgi:hypothetical protein